MLLKIRGRYYLLFLSILLAIVFFREPIISKINNIIKYPSTEEIKPPIITDKKIDNRAVSTGEDILIYRKPWLNEDKEVNNNCKLNWQLKLDLGFDQYLQQCPIDIEAKIYLNNQKAKEIAAKLTNSTIVNIAIVVPISERKNELRKEKNLSLEEEPNLNGKNSVFDVIEILTGIELVQRENINGIQLGDKKVFLEIAIVDDSYDDNISDEQKAQESANYLVDNQNTVAVIGHFSSDSIQAAASIYNNRLVAFSPTSTAIRTENSSTSDSDNSDKLKLNSYIFRTAPNDMVAIKTLIDVIRNENSKNTSLRTAMILYEEESSYSKQYKQHFEKEFLEKIENSEIVDNPSSSSCRFYNNESNNQKEICIQAIKDNKPDLLLLVPSSNNASNTAGTVLKRINDLEAKPQLLGADSMFDPRFQSDFAEGMIVAVPIKTLRINNIQLNWRGAMTYDAAKAIIKGIKNSKCDVESNETNDDTNNCIRRQIQKVLSEENFKADGILGNNTVFFKNGDRKINDALKNELEAPLQVKKIEDPDKYDFALY